MPHFGQSVFVSILSVWTLCLSTVWTIESFWRKREGKSEGFVRVVMVLGGWSGKPISRGFRHKGRVPRTRLGFQLRSSRNGGYSSRFPWMRAEDCRNLYRKSKNRLPTCLERAGRYGRNATKKLWELKVLLITETEQQSSNFLGCPLPAAFQKAWPCRWAWRTDRSVPTTRLWSQTGMGRRARVYSLAQSFWWIWS